MVSRREGWSERCLADRHLDSISIRSRFDRSDEKAQWITGKDRVSRAILSVLCYTTATDRIKRRNTLDFRWIIC